MHPKSSLSSSSKKWLHRAHKDPYSRLARQRCLRCRSYYKIEEMDNKYSLFKSVNTVLDLGCAPGGWSQYVSRKNISHIYGIDILPMKPISNVSFAQHDIFSESCSSYLYSLKHSRFQFIMCDISPNKTGFFYCDDAFMECLEEKMILLIKRFLSYKGHFVMKIFQSSRIPLMKQSLKKIFSFSTIYRCSVTYKSSSEIYIIGKFFKNLST